MAKMICRVCPMAKIYAIRLETHYDHKDQKAKIVAKSAAEVRLWIHDYPLSISSLSMLTPRIGHRRCSGQKSSDYLHVVDSQATREQ